MPFTARTLAKSYSHLRDLDLADDGQNETTATIDPLVGSDVYWSLVSGRGDSGPVALDTKVGWVLSGPVERPSSVTVSILSNSTRSQILLVDTNPIEPMSLDKGLKCFWDLEAIGVTTLEDPIRTKFTQEMTVVIE